MMEPQSETREPKEWRAASETAERMSEERSSERPIVDLLRQLARESEGLLRAEAQLLRTEMSEKFAYAERGITSMASGLALSLAGLILLLSALALALSGAMADWLAFLIVGAVAALVGGAMAAAGKRRVELQQLKPERSIEEARADSRFLKHEARLAKGRST